MSLRVSPTIGEVVSWLGHNLTWHIEKEERESEQIGRLFHVQREHVWAVNASAGLLSKKRIQNISFLVFRLHVSLAIWRACWGRPYTLDRKSGIWSVLSSPDQKLKLDVGLEAIGSNWLFNLGQSQPIIFMGSF
jgi:hypothetical protein